MRYCSKNYDTSLDLKSVVYATHPLRSSVCVVQLVPVSLRSTQAEVNNVIVATKRYEQEIPDHYSHCLSTIKDHGISSMSDSHNKPCTLCGTSRPVLVRCQIDDSGKWHMVCPGQCWKSVSGGQEDAKGFEDEYPHYRYGGMWKVRSAGIATWRTEHWRLILQLE